MYKIESAPLATFDCDGTIISWDVPEDYDGPIVEIECKGYINHVIPNVYNIDLLKKFASRNHQVVLWSKGGVDWAEAVAKALGLEKYISVVMSKPSYYIDDIEDSRLWMGQYGYYDFDGKRIHSKYLPNVKDGE